MCKFKDGKTGDDIFESFDKEEMEKHLKEVHGIDVTTVKPSKVPEIQPLSAILRPLFSSKPPMRVLMTEEIKDADTGEISIAEHELTFPLYSFPVPEFRIAPLEVLKFNGSYKADRIQFSLFAKVLRLEKFKWFSLPTGYHQACMNCPFCFKAQFSHFKTLCPENVISEEMIPIHEREFMLFKCDINICNGLRKTLVEKLIYWQNPNPPDLPDEIDPEPWIWEFFKEEDHPRESMNGYE